MLEVKDLATYFNASNSFFFKNNSLVKAVDDVSFQLFEGETLGLVGESGCGKTTLGRTILQLEKATKGTIFYNEKDVTNLSKKALKNLEKKFKLFFKIHFLL